MYWQIIIDDRTNLSGGAIARLVADIALITQCKAIAVYEFEGATDVRFWDAAIAGDAISLPIFLEKMRQVTQVDWGTFCLLRDPTVWSARDYMEKCCDCIRDNEAVVRCVDGQFFYVYTKRDDIAALLKTCQTPLSVERIELGNIEWPE